MSPMQRREGVSKVRYYVGMTLTVAAIFLVGVLWPSPADASTQCYPASSCGSSSGSSTSSYPAAPGVQNGDNYAWVPYTKCFVVGGVVAAGTVASGGSGAPAAGSIATASCGVGELY